MPHAELENGRIWLTLTPREHAAALLVAGASYVKRIDPDRFSYPLAWPQCIQLRAVFKEELTIGPALEEWAWRERRRQEWLRELGRLTSPPAEWPRDRRLWDLQEIGVEFLLQAKRAILGDEMGSGKTPQTVVATHRALLNHGGRALIVASKLSCEKVWLPHFEEWAPDLKPALAIGNIRQRRQAIESDADVIIMSYETLMTHTKLARYGNRAQKRCPDCDGPTEPGQAIPPQRCEAHPKELNLIDLRVVAADEAHKIKDPGAKRTRALWAAMAGADFRWVLTGTPIANHMGDAWSLLHAIAPEQWPSRTHYVDRYCAQGFSPHGGLNIVGVNPATADEFFQLIDSLFIRRLKPPTLPKKLPPIVRYVELPKAQRQLYDELRRDLIARIDGGVLMAPNPLTNAIRLRQLACSNIEIEQVPCDRCEGAAACDTCDGVGYTEKVRLTEPSPKLDALEDVLEELGEETPVVVFADFAQLIELAEARLTKSGITFSVLKGGQSDGERSFEYDRWQAGHTRVLLLTIGVGAESLTLTRAAHTVYLQRPWSRVANVQSEDRTHRPGQTREVTYIDIVTLDTIEDRVYEALREKDARFEEVVRDRNRLKELI